MMSTQITQEDLKVIEEMLVASEKRKMAYFETALVESEERKMAYFETALVESEERKMALLEESEERKMALLEESEERKIALLEESQRSNIAYFGKALAESQERVIDTVLKDSLMPVLKTLEDSYAMLAEKMDRLERKLAQIK